MNTCSSAGADAAQMLASSIHFQVESDASHEGSAGRRENSPQELPVAEPGADPGILFVRGPIPEFILILKIYANLGLITMK